MCLSLKNECVLCSRACHTRDKMSRFMCSDCQEIPHCSHCLTLDVESMTVFKDAKDLNSFSTYIKVIKCNNQECGSDEDQHSIEVITII